MHLILDTITDSLLGAILISGLVCVMMMMVECMSISTEGRFFKSLQKTRLGQITVSALLGAIPGCMGGFASVSLYAHGMLSFGALVAMMIASSGDEAFAMLAMFPKDAAWLFAGLFLLAIVSGLAIDALGIRAGSPTHPEHSCEDIQIHDEDRHSHDHSHHSHSERHFGWKRIALAIGVTAFIAALAGGLLEHEHEAEEAVHEGFNLLSEEWMNILFAVLSLAVLAVILTGPDHFVEGHLFHHVVAKHLPRIFAWSFGVLVFIAAIGNFVDISSWISNNTLLMILLAVAIGIIPESGPHLIFVTLYASGVLPLPALIASCISQDGHASLPLLAESKQAFIKAKTINCAIALAAGLASWGISLI